MRAETIAEFRRAFNTTEALRKLPTLRKLMGHGVADAGGCLEPNSSGAYHVQATGTCSSSGLTFNAQSSSSGLTFNAQTSCSGSNLTPVVITNKVGIAADSDVWVTVKGNVNAPDSKTQVFMKFNSPGCPGVGVPMEVLKNTISVDYAIRLSDLPSAGPTNAYTLHLPYTVSGRIYFSIKNPMNFRIDQVANPSTIIDPTGFASRELNYYTLYDKVEFTVNDGGFFANPTAVDFFSIPIALTWGSSSSGLTSSRADILNAVKASIDVATSAKTLPTVPQWNKLFLPYTGKDYSNADITITLRFSSPGKALIGTSTNINSPFDPNYLHDGISPTPSANSYGFDYITAIYAHYATPGKELKIDITEITTFITLKDYHLTGSVSGNVFTFNNMNNEPAARVQLQFPQTMDFFAGGGGVWITTNNTPEAIVVKAITAAFDAGLLPVPDGDELSKPYLTSRAGDFYKPSTIAPTDTGPWYDAYSEAFHKGTLSSQHIYTFAYDDFLGQDGTLSGPGTTFGITLGDMTGTGIPNPFVDPTLYTVTYTVGRACTTPSNPCTSFKYYTIVYNGQTLLPSSTTTTLSSVAVPMVVTIEGTPYDIYFLNPFVSPETTVSDGIVIGAITSNALQIDFPGPPA